MPITSEAELRALYGEVSPRAARKVLDRLDGHCRQVIAHSPIVLVATSDGRTVDVSPKGDPAVFLSVCGVQSTTGAERAPRRIAPSLTDPRPQVKASEAATEGPALSAADGD